MQGPGTELAARVHLLPVRLRPVFRVSHRRPVSCARSFGYGATGVATRCRGRQRSGSKKMQRVLGLLLGVVLAAAAERAFASPQPGADDRRAILVFIGDDFSRPWVQGMIDGFRTAVLSQPDPPVLYVETLDALRFGDQAYIEEFRDWLRLKDRERKIDLIVPLGEEGLDFLARRSGDPWPGVPVLYADVGAVSVDTRRDLPQAIGMSFEDSFPASLGIIKQILPGTRRVALVMGASELEWKRFGGFADKVRLANLGLEPMPLNRPSLEATVEAASHLPDDAVVFILAPATDATGRTLTQTEACERLSAAANRPSFLMGRHDLGCGAVGGLLRDFRIFGSVVGGGAGAGRSRRRPHAVGPRPVGALHAAGVRPPPAQSMVDRRELAAREQHDSLPPGESLARSPAVDSGGARGGRRPDLSHRRPH